MKKISFNGKEYVRASEAAKKFRYTQDYVGQLCRSKKVNARLVGRSWYVELDSITAYRKTKHQTQKSAVRTTKSSAASSSRTKPKTSVEPVLRTKTVKHTSAAKKKRRGVTAAYQTDDTTLVPILQGAATEKVKKVRATTKSTQSSPATVQIEQRPTVTVRVASEHKRMTKFTTEKLPEISLSGKLSVANSTDEVPSDFMMSAEEEKTPVVIESVEKTVDTGLEASEANEIEAGVGDFGEMSEEMADQPSKNLFVYKKQPVRQISTVGFTPAAVQEGVSAAKRVSWPAVLVLSMAILVAGGLLGLSHETVVSGESYSNHWGLDFRGLF